jgi:hypothetical protein
LSRRRDLAALVLVLVFGAFANAAGMVGPVLEWQDRLGGWLGVRSRSLVTGAFSLLTLIAMPPLLCTAAARVSRRWGKLAPRWPEVATRYVYALVPLGFSMWLAHASFHFLTGSDAAVPTAQRFVADLGWAFLGEPEWSRACCRPVGEWLLKLEVVFLDLGMLGSLYVAYRISLELGSRPSRALKALAPWATLIVLLFAVGIWIVFQPMEMRGTLSGAG